MLLYVIRKREGRVERYELRCSIYLLRQGFQQRQTQPPNGTLRHYRRNRQKLSNKVNGEHLQPMAWRNALGEKESSQSQLLR